MSDSTNLMNGQEEKREEENEKGGKKGLLKSVKNGVMYIGLSAIPLVILYVIIYLFRYSGNKEVASVLDFVISGLSANVLIISVVDIFIKKKKKWIVTLLYINLPIYTILAILYFSTKISNLTFLSRIISIVCLIASLVVQGITCLRYEKEADDAVAQKKEDKDANKKSSDEK